MSRFTHAPFEKDLHLPLLLKWWAQYYEGDEFPEYCVPGNGAVCLDENGEIVGSIFLYVYDCKIAVTALPMVKPDATLIDKIEILNVLAKGCVEQGQNIFGDKGVIFGITHNSSVGSALMKNGFADNGPMKTFAYAFGGANIEFLE